MNLRVLTVLCLAAIPGAAMDGFAPPQAHPVERYQAGWKKNPFTRKTAPVAVTRESFAKDLALAGWRQAGDDTIVILVNTRTREYSRLRNNEATTDGVKVKQAELRDRRADTFVVLERGGETAVVRYNEGFLRQAAAQQPLAAATPTQTPQVVAGQPGVAGMLAPRPGASPAAPGNALAASAQPQPAAPNVPTAAPPMPVIPGAAPATASPPGKQPNIPTIPRRRMLTAPQSRPNQP